MTILPLSDEALELEILRALEAGGMTSDQVHDAVPEVAFSRVYNRCTEMQKRGLIFFLPHGCVWKISSSGKLWLKKGGL